MLSHINPVPLLFGFELALLLILVLVPPPLIYVLYIIICMQTHTLYLPIAAVPPKARAPMTCCKKKNQEQDNLPSVNTLSPIGRGVLKLML